MPSSISPSLAQADFQRCLKLMIIPWHESAALACEEIEVHAFVRLQHVVEIQPPVAALQRRLGLFPFSAPLRELVLPHDELEAPLRDVELDDIVVFDQN